MKSFIVFILTSFIQNHLKNKKDLTKEVLKYGREMGLEPTAFRTTI
jgi:phage terminase small subunit